MQDNKNLKNTILELIKEKDELEEKVETLELLEEEATQNAEQMQIELKLLKS